MADKGFPSGIRELKLGESFNNDTCAEFHTLKYDFKPESVEADEEGTMQITSTNQVTVTHSQPEGEDISQVVYKGCAKDYQKEYVLIVDHDTGEVTLERLSKNIQLKKTRVITTNKQSQHKHIRQKAQSKETEEEIANYDDDCSSPKPSESINNTVHHKFGLTLHSPLHPSPSRKSPADGKQKSPCGSASSMESSPKMVSLTTTGGGDSPSSETSDYTMSQFDNDQLSFGLPSTSNELEIAIRNTIGSISSESSSDSSSDNDDSESDESTSSKHNPQLNGYLNGLHENSSIANNIGLLHDDLKLSESGSDSD